MNMLNVPKALRQTSGIWSGSLPWSYAPFGLQSSLRILCVAGLLGGASPIHAADQGEAAYLDALELARKGQPAQALPELQNLVSQNPDNRRYLYDYLTVLGWAEMDAEVIALLPQIDLEAAPLYVLETVGKSARNVRRYDLAVQAYRTALRRDPASSGSAVGLAFALADSGQPDAALDVVTGAAAQAPQRIDVLEARAYVLGVKKDYFQQLAVYQRILQIYPNHRGARRGLVRVAARLGAPGLALKLWQEDRSLLPYEELQAILRDSAALTIRWGGAPAYPETERFRDTDRALRESDEMLVALRKDGRGLSADAHKVLFDRLVALRERQRMVEAVALYEQLNADDVQVPAYSRNAAADAYLYLEMPEVARDLYLEVLREQPGDFKVQLALFYAYVESEDFPRALELVDRVAAAQPAQIQAYSPATARSNPDYESALTTSAWGRALADDLGESESRLVKLAEKAPFNMAIRSNLAHVYEMRGWPRRADEEYRWVLSAEPEYLEARIGRVEALQTLAEFRQTERELAPLVAEYPENKHVQRLQRVWNAHNMHELYVETSLGLGGGPAGRRDLSLDAYLYTRPLDYNYRVFGHTHQAEASFPEGDASRRRLGVGMEYTARDIVLSGEVSHGTDSTADPAASLSAAWMPDDFWRIRGSYSSSTDSAPLQAFLHDIHASSAVLEATYRVSESRRFNAGLERLNFDDGNQRDSLFGSYFQRLITGPVYKLDGILGLSASRNSREDAPYFNPKEDSSVDVTLENEWLGYRRYARSFRHRIAFSYGNYWQQDFGSGATAALRYEQVWDWDNTLFLRYGVGRTMHPYDGVREYRNLFFLVLDWRF